MNEYLKSNSGLEVVKINGYLTHSIYNPIKEAEKFVEKNIEDVQIHFIYGYGNGYIVKKFLENNIFNTRYIIIDPFIDISSLQDENADFIFFQDINLLKEKIRAYITINNNIKVTCSLNYDKIDPSLYLDFLNMLKELMSLSKVNENTVLVRAYLWYENYLNNLIYEDSSIVNLKKITNMPIVVASGGPSLTKQLPLLKKYRKHLILISAGSTTNSLVSENIIPDFVLSIDGHLRNYEHFKLLNFDENTKFIYSMYSYPKIRESFLEGYYFLDKSAETLGTHLYKNKGEETVILNGGGSVAHYALIFATYITTGPICLIGQDLAYTDGKSHAKNNVFAKEMTKQENANLLEIEGYYGDTVLTDYMFLSMKRSFEGLMENIDKNSIYNCTEGGALIKGMPNETFNHFCEMYVELDKTFSFKKVAKKGQTNVLFKALKKEQENYLEIEKAINSNLTLIKKAKKLNAYTNDILRKMDRNDLDIKKITEYTALPIAFQPISINVHRNFKRHIHETQKMKLMHSFEENEFLYTEMKNVLLVGKEKIHEYIKKVGENEHEH
ncbi:motility associated factor glycosyltransferase family protein [Rummeliibacillus pycnus]|uniref:motility associated factor glycosyltransferase family protein n=1 Tax=Rummeliibacillus pycnus TaxID=101070 RepID=UPI003D2AD439